MTLERLFGNLWYLYQPTHLTASSCFVLTVTCIRISLAHVIRRHWCPFIKVLWSLAGLVTFSALPCEMGYLTLCCQMNFRPWRRVLRPGEKLKKVLSHGTYPCWKWKWLLFSASGLGYVRQESGSLEEMPQKILWIGHILFQKGIWSEYVWIVLTTLTMAMFQQLNCCELTWCQR